MELSWVALQVRPKSEKFVATCLLYKQIEAFLPFYKTRHRWSDRVKEIELPLFDGYVFCRLDLLHRLPVLTIPNVIRIVGIGKTPVPVDAQEILTLQAATKSGLAASPWPFLRAGQKVRVEHGPLRDLEGILVQEKGSARLILSISLLQRSVAVELDRDSVAPVGAGRRSRAA